MTDLLKTYIKSITQNVDKSKIPKEIDLIFDGGALNGFIGQGIAMYIKELEASNLVKVNRISGCSAGALIGTLYILNIYHDMNDAFLNIVEHLKENLNLSKYKEQIKSFIYEHTKDDDMSLFNQRLYITYYDLKKQRQIVVCNYKNRAHLLECLIRSSHIPYITAPEFKYKNRYLDGVIPYVFRDQTRPALLISLITTNTINRSICVKNEYNSYSRLLLGVTEADTFFTKGKSNMCNYIQEWNILKKIFSLSNMCIVPPNMGNRSFTPNLA